MKTSPNTRSKYNSSASRNARSSNQPRNRGTVGWKWTGSCSQEGTGCFGKKDGGGRGGILPRDRAGGAGVRRRSLQCQRRKPAGLWKKYERGMELKRALHRTWIDRPCHKGQSFLATGLSSQWQVPFVPTPGPLLVLPSSYHKVVQESVPFRDPAQAAMAFKMTVERNGLPTFHQPGRLYSSTSPFPTPTAGIPCILTRYKHV